MRGPAAILTLVLLVAAACGDRPEPDATAPSTQTPPAVAPAAGPDPAAAPTSVAAPAVALDPEGLRLVDAATGATRLLPFGAAADEALAVVQRAGRTAPKRSTLAECGAGPLAFADWPDGLKLVLQEDRFAGWSVGKRGLTTMSGVGVGSTRAELTSAYAAEIAESTLGVEFNVGGLGGLLSGPGASDRIEILWAGVSCVFR